MKPTDYLVLGFGALMAYVLYVNVVGKKDPAINYQSKPKFTNPLGQ